ncbi:MAG: methyltransferase domain-containing protein [Phycisphaerales bacterium]
MATLLHTAIRPVEVRAPEARSVPPAPAGADGRIWAEWFDRLYTEAAGDPARVPWADGAPSPALVAWLNSEAPAMIRPGATAVVVGCGLGDDVRELADRGYDATGFDVSPAAVDWARRQHPDLAERFLVADVTALSANLRRRADLVVEVSTIQAVHPALRQAVTGGIAALARPRGVVLAICRGRDEHEPLDRVEGPPFALTAHELVALFEHEGFAPVGGRQPDDFTEDGEPPKGGCRRLRAALRRAQ